MSPVPVIVREQSESSRASSRDRRRDDGRHDDGDRCADEVGEAASSRSTVETRTRDHSGSIRRLDSLLPAQHDGAGNVGPGSVRTHSTRVTC